MDSATPSARPGHAAATAAALALLVAGAAALWQRFNAQPLVVDAQYPSDLLNYFIPRAGFVGDRLAHGELPLWNPHDCSGFPELATAQHAALHPATWLYALLPIATALPLRMFLECALGGALAVLLFRSGGAGAIPAATGGILYLGVCLLGQTFWPPEVSTLAWLPWLPLCGERFVRTGRWRWWVGLCLGTALILLSGFPQFAVYAFYLAVPWTALAIWEQRAELRAPLRTAAWLVLALALGAGLAAPQLLPSLELVGESLREGPLRPGDVHYLSSASSSAIHTLRNAVDPSTGPITFDFGGGGGYLGVPALVLAAAGVVAGRFRRVALLAGLGVLALLLSDGHRGAAGDLYRLYATLPTGDLFRTPERLRVLTFVAAIALAVMGFDRAARGFPSLSRGRAAAALGAAGGAALAVAIVGGTGAAWRAALALALLGACTALARRPLPALLASACLAFFAIADVVHATAATGALRSLPVGFAQTYHVFGHALATAPAIDRFERELGLDRVQLPLASPYTTDLEAGAFYRASCYEPLAPAAWGELQRAMGGRSDLGQLFLQASPKHFPSFFDVASVRGFVRPAGPVGSDPAAAIAAMAQFDRTWRARRAPLAPPPESEPVFDANLDALPRAYLATHFRVASRSDALAHVAHGTLDFQRSVLIESAPAGVTAPPTAAPVRPARIHSYTPERVEIEVETEPPAWLVLTDTFYPGWQASVDGAPAEITRANGLYRAVRVPTGTHLVVFEYRPASFRLGAAVALACLGLVITLPAWARRRDTASAPF